jgi:neutral trehalase
LSDRAAYWNNTAAATTDALLEHLWNPAKGFFYDRYFNGTLLDIKTVAGFYPLLANRIPAAQVNGMVAMLKAKDFATAVPVPTVGIFTPDFSSDLDRGPMWEQQNLYIIRGLRKYGFDTEADELKRVSLEVVKHYYEQWGSVFEFCESFLVNVATGCCTVVGHCLSRKSSQMMRSTRRIRLKRYGSLPKLTLGRVNKG